MTYKVSCWGESKTSEKCQQTAKEWNVIAMNIVIAGKTLELSKLDLLKLLHMKTLTVANTSVWDGVKGWFVTNLHRCCVRRNEARSWFEPQRFH